jgi:hypothetical protein
MSDQLKPDDGSRAAVDRHWLRRLHVRLRVEPIPYGLIDDGTSAGYTCWCFCFCSLDQQRSTAEDTDLTGHGRLSGAIHLFDQEMAQAAAALVVHRRR